MISTKTWIKKGFLPGDVAWVVTNLCCKVLNQVILYSSKASVLWLIVSCTIKLHPPCSSKKPACKKLYFSQVWQNRLLYFGVVISN